MSESQGLQHSLKQRLRELIQFSTLSPSQFLIFECVVHKCTNCLGQEFILHKFLVRSSAKLLIVLVFLVYASVKHSGVGI